MGTSAAVQVKANDKVGYFFRGSDGYPTGLGLDLAVFCSHARSTYNLKHILYEDFATMFNQYMEDRIKGTDLVEDTSPESDADFIYGIDFDANRFVVLVNGCMVFDGTIAEWKGNATKLKFGIVRLLFEDNKE